LPSDTSDVIVQHGLNANSPEAASKRELSHLTVQNEGSRKNRKTVRGAFFEETRHFKIYLSFNAERARQRRARQKTR
jgi:uncharacterized protein (DUF2141 family)